METTPQTASQHTVPARTASVLMGRQGYISVLLRLAGMELYKLRRRSLSKVLGSIALIVVLSTFFLLSLGLFYTANAPASDFGSSSCPPGTPIQNCTGTSPVQQEAAKQAEVRNSATPLLLPSSLNLVEQVVRSLGTLLIIILVGTIVGGEYGLGTVRLMFTRGPTRTQFLLAKALAALFCIAAALLILIPLGVILGLVLSTLAGVQPDFTFFNPGWLGHAILLLLLSMLTLFVYAMMALFLGTLGRTTVAGVAGALTWALLEPVAGEVLRIVGSIAKGNVGAALTAIPDYFVSSNTGALIQNQERYLFGGDTSSISDIHALLVLALYLLLFIGIAVWVNRRRDITN